MQRKPLKWPHSRVSASCVCLFFKLHFIERFLVMKIQWSFSLLPMLPPSPLVHVIIVMRCCGFSARWALFSLHFIVILSAWDLNWLERKELLFASFLSLWIFINEKWKKRKFFCCTRERWNVTLKVARWNVKIYYENVSTLTLWHWHIAIHISLICAQRKAIWVNI